MSSGCRQAPILTRVVVATVFAAAAVILAEVSALAHARLQGSEPADGSTVRPPLPVVTLTFNEPVQSARVVVRAPSGGDAATGPAERDPSSPQVVRVPVAASEPGAYTVEYSVLSVDGHPVRGQLSFTLVGGASAEQPSGQPSGVSADSPTGSPGSPARPGAGAIWYGAGAVAVVAAVAALRRSRH